MTIQYAIRDMTPEGYGPGENTVFVRREIQRRTGETLDEAVAREVGYHIEDGRVKLTETRDGWKAAVSSVIYDKPRVFQAFKKQDVLNLVHRDLYPDSY